jgi:hypothetical protein
VRSRDGDQNEHGDKIPAAAAAQPMTSGIHVIGSGAERRIARCTRTHRGYTTAVSAVPDAARSSASAVRSRALLNSGNS